MAGLFSWLYGGRSGHGRTRSAADVGAPSQLSAEVTFSSTHAPAVNSLGPGYSAEYRPVEHPTEPINHDQPVRCPLPEPSVQNDGRMLKERVSATARRTADLPAVMEGTTVQPGSAKHVILPSQSVPEQYLVKLLEERNAS